MAPIQTGPATRGLQILAVPAVCMLIAFLGYSSQWLFHVAEDLAPGPLTPREFVAFNSLLLCLWWTYFKACTVDPGRYPPLPSSAPESSVNNSSNTTAERKSGGASKSSVAAAAASAARYCKKCRAPKPPRAHHCRHCGRCIPKMDHHCPWTGNCVSMQTFPHFLRFLAFTNLSLWTLASHLYARFAALWASRHLPAYLGPTLPQLIHLTVLGLVCSAVCLALAIMLFTTGRAWVLNTTMIEGWEIERHEAVLDRYSSSSSGDSSSGSWWDPQDGGAGAGAELERVEFPYDVGFFANMAQAMGTPNALLWLWPFAGGPRISPGGRGPGWDWEENGFNDREGLWPPPDPEKLRRARTGGWPGAAAATRQGGGGGGGYYDRDATTTTTPEEEKAAFAARQRRWDHIGDRSGIVAELEEDEDFPEGHYDRYDDRYDDDGDIQEEEEGMDGEPGWTNADGDRLRDYGVDEDADAAADVPCLRTMGTDVAHKLGSNNRSSSGRSNNYNDDDDVPLAELLRRRKVRERDGES
ncbi:uncharacterized protein E0L32_011961 [Thyridium curvatum]|uniref:Palmitoyltransferase PFA4 n=1 Tax=Thyridium curvatum TaxID=1093900 RepID=A0A507BMJ7_9PEZI|nr:uncharacterized protein E0L32_011961 [Thyridium curvatum]TPX17960.1 hypothetical protein E0L32_011961 [Thyridium curvatum]